MMKDRAGRTSSLWYVGAWGGTHYPSTAVQARGRAKLWGPMSEASPVRIPLNCLTNRRDRQDHFSEPITFGMPWPMGVVREEGRIQLEDACGSLAAQVRALDRWPDGSLRWTLIDCHCRPGSGRSLSAVLSAERTSCAEPIVVRQLADSLEVSTGAAKFVFRVGAAFPFPEIHIGGMPVLQTPDSGARIAFNDAELRTEISELAVNADGPLRAEVHVRGVLKPKQESVPLEFAARVEMFAGMGAMRCDVTIRNTRRAAHPGGKWPLGDEGSVLLKGVDLRLKLTESAESIDYSAEEQQAVRRGGPSFVLLQESSGGDHWNGPVHRNRDGVVPLRFRGYRLTTDGIESTGLRAKPAVVVRTPASQVGITFPRFWEEFPKALAVEADTVTAGFFPRETSDLHELQGGEQKTLTVGLVFAAGGLDVTQLEWMRDPARVSPAPDWFSETAVVPFLRPPAGTAETGYLELISRALDTESGFFQKREQADEYGWRNFGDLYADHEAAFQPAGQPFVSHYNNQYDAIMGFAIHFMRTGDRRWWVLMDDLARHVRDIDIYRTMSDKSAYNGGLFWHTYHYGDAGTATHRTYPREGPHGGGPSSEHNYNAGLMVHYFLTGDPASRDAAIGLGRWVLEMDDGKRTPLRWLAGGATGFASASGSPLYHGPGRGAANSIMACVVAHQLTGDADFSRKAEELLRRCIHPDDDIPALNLLDAERRWYYTIFLQVVARYLDTKESRSEYDDHYVHARESLLNYARWMSQHERPYLDHPEILEFPNETWAAQDMRKAEVFFWAALHAGTEERKLFLERSRFFRDYSLRTLSGMPGHRFTRPLVLLLTNGFRLESLDSLAGQPPRPARSLPASRFRRSRFEPQKSIALRRAKWLGIAMSAAAVSLALFWAMS